MLPGNWGRRGKEDTTLLGDYPVVSSIHLQCLITSEQIFTELFQLVQRIRAQLERLRFTTDTKLLSFLRLIAFWYTRRHFAGPKDILCSKSKKNACKILPRVEEGWQFGAAADPRWRYRTVREKRLGLCPQMRDPICFYRTYHSPYNSRPLYNHLSRRSGICCWSVANFL